MFCIFLVCILLYFGFYFSRSWPDVVFLPLWPLICRLGWQRFYIMHRFHLKTTACFCARVSKCTQEAHRLIFTEQINSLAAFVSYRKVRFRHVNAALQQQRNKNNVLVTEHAEYFIATLFYHSYHGEPESSINKYYARDHARQCWRHKLLVTLKAVTVYGSNARAPSRVVWWRV